MTKRSQLLGFTALVALSAGMAHAQAVAIDGEVTRTKVEAAYSAYEFIDIRYGLTQVKVEAVDSETNRKVEAVYDKATGRLIKVEAEAAGDDAGRTGIVTRSVTRDFEDDGRDDRTSGDDDDGIDDTTGSDDDGMDDNTRSDDDGRDDNTRGDDDNSGSSSNSGSSNSGSSNDDNTSGDDD
jgi:hypothetical protein